MSNPEFSLRELESRFALRELPPRFALREGRIGIDARFPTDARFADPEGTVSIMRYIPPFLACRALTAAAKAGTPSNTVGDWMLPSAVPAGCVEGVDVQTVGMGGYWVDLYLCASRDATAASMGTLANGTVGKIAYHSLAGVAPRVSQSIAHFKQYLAARFAAGSGFVAGDGPQGVSWVGKGGLLTDQHWYELRIWARITGITLHGNTAGYSGTVPKLPTCHRDGDTGTQDTSQSLTYGASVTGAGPANWLVPISDFCGNRWEFTDGLRLYNNGVYSAGKALNPPGSYSDPAYSNTGLTITGVSSGASVATLRTEAVLAPHGIPASTTTAGAGPFDGAGFWATATDERVALRGGGCNYGAQCPGALGLTFAPSVASWDVGARAVLVP
jgi:hypothetical protein